MEKCEYPGNNQNAKVSTNPKILTRLVSAWIYYDLGRTMKIDIKTSKSEVTDGLIIIGGALLMYFFTVEVCKYAEIEMLKMVFWDM